jgi:hypothetical protein
MSLGDLIIGTWYVAHWVSRSYLGFHEAIRPFRPVNIARRLRFYIKIKSKSIPVTAPAELGRLSRIDSPPIKVWPRGKPYLMR